MATDGYYVLKRGSSTKICKKKQMMVHDISRKQKTSRLPSARSGVHLGGDGRVQILKFMFLLLHLGTLDPGSWPADWPAGPETMEDMAGRKTHKKKNVDMANCTVLHLSLVVHVVLTSSTEDIVEAKTQRSLTLKIAFQSRMWLVVEGTPVTKGERYPHSSIMHITPGGCVSRFATRT